MKAEQYKRKDRTMHIAEYFYTAKIVKPLLPIIAQTRITPNMVTIFNSFLAMYIFYLSYSQRYTVVAILIQVYLFLDILDGNLARYKNMKSNLGAKLDSINDRIFYSLIFIFVGITEVPWYLIISVILLVNIYGILATFYIVPKLRQLKAIRRRGIKKFFMDKGFIIGMDLGTVDILMTVFLLLGRIRILYIILIIGFIFDIIVRLRELWWNERLEKASKFNY